MLDAEGRQDRAVHWYEGMFLWPHQMQAAERHVLRQLHLSHKWDLHYDWGLRALQLDAAGLANYRLAVRALHARIPGGTLIVAPDDGTLSAIDLRPALQREERVTVYLGVPKLDLGKANAADHAAPAAPEGQPQRPTRYVLASEEVEDENTADVAQPLQVRLLNFKLLLSTEDRSGYETVPVARVQRGLQPDAPPQLDRSYIPPLLACDAWHVLYADILQTVFHKVGKKVELRAQQVVSRGINFDSRAAEDPQIFSELHVLNEAYSLLNVLAFAQGVHPLPAYLELCRLVGQLAIFAPARKVPELPRYDHDDLGGCFWRVKQYLDDLLAEVRELSYEEREFEGQGLRMQVAMEPKWLEPAWDMFVGVESPLSPEECVRLLTKAGQLDMKIGSAHRVDEIFEGGARGLTFMPCGAPPRALPARGGLVYFQVSRESQQQEWQHVQKSLTLAIRLNQNRVVGNIQGQKVLTIKTGNQTTTMRFALYLVPQQG